MRTLLEWQADKRREWLAARATARDLTPPPPAAWAAFGRSTIVPPGRVTNADCISVGDGVVILENVWFSVVRPFDDLRPSVIIEDNVHIGRGCGFGIAGDLVIGKNTVMGDFAMVIDTIHPYEAEERLHAVARPLSVTIGEDVVLGPHSVILPGVTIGAGAYVEHHAVVGRDVAPGDRVAGYPARRQTGAVAS
jgi:acetyltransferase-like isoleucine patch superfamily enzyme